MLTKIILFWEASPFQDVDKVLQRLFCVHTHTFKEQSCDNLHIPLPHPQDENEVSYLPLSHVAAQMMDIHAPLEKGITIWFAQSDALKGTLVQTLKVRTAISGPSPCL